MNNTATGHPRRWAILGVLVVSLLVVVLDNSVLNVALKTIQEDLGATQNEIVWAIITVVFPPHERGRAIGMWAAAVGGAIAIGPLLGGFLLEHYWWGSVFLINVPIVAIGVIGILALVPESRNPNPGRLDPLGLVLSVSGLLLLVYGIQHGGDTQDWLSPSVGGAITAGIAILALFLWLELRSDHPSLDMSLFRIRSFSVSLSVVSLTFAAMTGSLLFFAFYMQLVRGYSPLQAGAFTLPVAVGQLLAAPRSAGMVERFGARRVIGFGLTLTALVFASILLFKPETPAWILLVVWFFLGFGLGNVVAPSTTRMTLATPPEKSGAGSAVQNTVRQVAAAIGVAVLSSVVAVVYSNSMDSKAGIDQLPAILKTPVTDSIGGAFEATGKAVAAGALQPQQAAAIQQASIDSFMSAFHLAALASMVLVLIALVILVLRLPAQPEHAAWGGHSGSEDVVDPTLSPDAFAGEGADEQP